MPKVTRTYSVEDNLYKIFDTMCKEQNINKSSFVQNCLSSFVLDRAKKDMLYEYYKNGNGDKLFRIIGIDKTDDWDIIYRLDDDTDIKYEDFVVDFSRKSFNNDWFASNSIGDIDRMINDNKINL